MNNTSQGRFFIVNTDCLATVLRPNKKKPGEVQTEKELGQGSIVKELVTDRHERYNSMHRSRVLVVTIVDMENVNDAYMVEMKYLSGVSDADAFLLLSVENRRERISFFHSKDVMNEAKSIKEGTRILLQFDDSTENSLPGLVKEKGFFDDYPGTQFTVCLGADNKKRSRDDNDIIVPFYKLRIDKSSHSDNTINISSKLHQQLASNSSQSGSKQFNLNERVGLLSDKGTWELGTVKHLGAIPGEKEVLVGVEFDNPVGTGDGRYKGKTVFQTKPKHAAFVPIELLRKKKDIPTSTTTRLNIFKSKKKDSSDKKQVIGSSVFYDEKTQTKSGKISPPFKAYQDKPTVSPPPVTFDIAKAIIGVSDDYVKHETSTPSSKIQKPPSPLQSPAIANDENVPVNRTPPSSPYSASVQVRRFPTSNEQKSPTQERHFSTERISPSRSPVTSKTNSTEQPILKLRVKTTPSPKQHRRTNSSVETPEQIRPRSTQSMERNAILSPTTPIVSAPYDQWVENRIEKDPKIELWSDKVKNGKQRSTESVKIENLLPQKHEQTNSFHKITIRSAPESPDVSDYYHVVEDDCIADECADVEIPPYSDLDKYLSLTDFAVSDLGCEESEFVVGSVVEVTITEQPWYGLIRWIGRLEDSPKIAGLEMEDTHNAFGDGEMNGVRYFTCPPQKGFFVYLRLCRRDGRFLDSLQVNLNEGRLAQAFGSIDCPAVLGEVPPLSYSEYVFKHFFGKDKGIQGHHNSCYLDATLFSMFTFTPVFDDLLNRPPKSSDIDSYHQVQQVLKEEIVNPLRRNMYVRADRVMGLRKLLDKLSSVSGLTSEEKDPEEFLNSLLHQILKAEPYLKLSSGQEAYFYQLFVEKNENFRVPTVQQLFDQSFLTSDIKLKEIPSCLIIQMPRHGKQYKMYNRIFPSPILDITDVLEDSPRECIICGELAYYECRDCFSQLEPLFTLKAFCQHCVRLIHKPESRSNHKTRKIKGMEGFKEMKYQSRVTMELFAVVCIETSHYVAFAKCGNECDVPWCFFDSMADRRGEQNGYNIPEVVLCKDLSEWLSEAGSKALENEPDRQLPDMPKRLFSDAYLCMYQNSSVMMYH